MRDGLSIWSLLSDPPPTAARNSVAAAIQTTPINVKDVLSLRKIKVIWHCARGISLHKLALRSVYRLSIEWNTYGS
jgi:hypothetical protein